MKLLHTADLHLGKIVNGVSMLAEQAYILKQITTIIEEEAVDAILLAGDLYDRSVPPTEAVNLLNDTLYTWNVKLGKPVFAISGNHDSADRLAFGAAWYREQQFFMAGKLTAEIEPISFEDAQIWLVPYHEPATFRALSKNDAVKSFDDAFRQITMDIRKKQDSSKRQILVGHAFVSGGLPSDSERQLSIGNVDRVAVDVFDGFDYVALGHLHHPHAIRHDVIHYSGSPLKYSFSEANDHKSVRIVELNGEQLTVRERLLTPKHDLRIIEGSLEELTTHIDARPDDYLQIKLTDSGALIDPIGKLRKFYPNILHLERKRANQQTVKTEAFEEVVKKDDLELFEQFFHEVSGTEITAHQKKLVQDVIRQVKAGDEK
ncbi:exonuclease SbcCD subunit D [Listeria costaricensis]|uniref:exonuclease SbcCD subunit D n=1 Tax=Listeria costaricensis TaxID=2026604 RepID=UPI000C08421A|nr:exonuclease SbcCD subunit D [Listeria costaricensis]